MAIVTALSSVNYRPYTPGRRGPSFSTKSTSDPERDYFLLPFSLYWVRTISGLSSSPRGTRSYRLIEETQEEARIAQTQGEE
jgi:hypothetical protein